MSYEIVLLSAARQAVIEMPADEQLELAAALRTELSDLASSPTVEFEPWPTHTKYLIKALVSGHVAVYREMTPGELEDLEGSLRRQVDDCGYAVFDILTGGDAFPGGTVKS